MLRYALLLLLAACHPLQSATPVQGVIELDEAVQGFEVAGRVAEVPVHRGQWVKAGDILALLDDTLASLERDQRAADVHTLGDELALLRAGTREEEVNGAEAELAGARAEEEVAERQLKRQRDLLASHSVAESSVDPLIANLAASRAKRRSAEERYGALRKGARSLEIAAAASKLGSAEAALAFSTQRLARHQVHASFSGQVVDVAVKPGEVAQPGAPAVTIANIDHPYVDVFVDMAQIAQVTLGLKAAVAVYGSSATVSGVVEDIGRNSEFTPRFLFSPRELPNLVIRVRVRVDDPAHLLRAGQPAFVTFSAGKA